MSTESLLPARSGRPLAGLTFALTLAASALAQSPSGAPVLANPVPGAAAQPSPPGVSNGGIPGVGSGPGFHDPRSPFKPLEDKPGVVPWATLASVTTRSEKNRLVPIFPQPVQALNNKVVKVQGFMMPLEPGDRQKHFLLSAVPTSCSFCVPAGPEGMVEVRSRTPVKYTLEPVVVEGRLAVLSNDPYGLYYRIVDAQPAP